MAYGCFIEKGTRPSAEMAVAAVGAAAQRWNEFLSDLESRTGATPVWRFYGRNYGWALAFKKSGRALAALFPDKGRLTVLVVLNGEQSDLAVADAELSARTKALVASLHRFKEGCWVFQPVDGAIAAADAHRLIAIRAG